jgi:hypothetical protein
MNILKKGFVVLLTLGTVSSALAAQEPGPTEMIDRQMIQSEGKEDSQAADPESRQWAEVKAKMKAEGWSQIGDGVFERRLGTGKVEHLGYGKEGLAWTIGELRRQLGSLKQQYQSQPSEELGKIIDELSVKISSAEHELRAAPKGMSRLTAALAGASCSNICYSATADAYPLTSTQGVAAVADAKFNSSCGYSGDAYAYAYAVATLSGTTTTISQSDPHTGTNVTSHAAASVNGGSITGTPCASSASSYAQSSTLGISYTTSATNSLCPASPPPPMSVAISGTYYEYFSGPGGCRSRTWTATVSNGASPFSYVWKKNGTVVGTNSSTYTQTICPIAGGFTLDVTATGSNSVSAAAPQYYVTVEYDSCNPYCQ